MCANINTHPVQLCRQATAVVNQADHCLTVGVVNAVNRVRRSEPVAHNHRPLC